MRSLSAFELTPQRAKEHEWLLSNGAGGYSFSTAIGMNTRKYHGLLVAPLSASGAGNRHVLLSKVEETAECNGKQYPLSTNAYPGTVYPTGFMHQIGFSFGRHPAFTYSLDGARLEKSVRMLHGKDAVVISYRLASGSETQLSIRPMLSFRQIHADPKTEIAEIPFWEDRYGFETRKPSASMRMCASAGKFSAAPLKYYNMVYPEERERGYAFSETLFSPGEFSARLKIGDELHLCASREMLSPSEALDILDRQEFRFSHLAREHCQLNGMERTDFGDELLFAADSFVGIRGSSHFIIAGFPWFSPWTRDSMISLPGLLLCTGRHALAREILSSHAKLLQDGLLPNFVDGAGKPHYNSADASLWFINAVREYTQATGDFEFVKSRLWKPMREMILSYVHGNSLVEMDSDCLISVKEPSATWMDAKVGGKAVTPRKGKPVEINALWHSNLCFAGELAVRFSDMKAHELASETSQGVRESFSKFMIAGEGGMFDIIEPNDPTVRPNQIFAVSLPHSPINEIQRKHVFNLVRSRLYTPLGLRTLPADAQNYHEKYEGSQEKRDAAYHQGMVWPWLLGAFFDAQLSVYPDSDRQVLAALKPFSEAMNAGCLGTVPEIYEPATMKPAGAVSQAWSVAEVLRIYTKVKRTKTATDRIAARNAALAVKI
ncbi:MAG: amylo-alpha-1,6-glucosidase [Candidatus Anstonellaceae archaeon]